MSIYPTVPLIPASLSTFFSLHELFIRQGFSRRILGTKLKSIVTVHNGNFLHCYQPSFEPQFLRTLTFSQEYSHFQSLYIVFIDKNLKLNKLKMSDSDKEENDEVGKDKNVILHVAVVGFHHKKGEI